MNKRVTELEIKVAYQEDTLQQLDAVICEQQKQIDTLNKKILHVIEQNQVLAQGTKNSSDNAQEIPPHY